MSSPKPPRLPSLLRDELDACGHPWAIESGKRHFKLLVAGRFVGILPQGGISETDRRAVLNTRAQIRRAVQHLGESM